MKLSLRDASIGAFGFNSLEAVAAQPITRSPGISLASWRETPGFGLLDWQDEPADACSEHRHGYARRACVVAVAAAGAVAVECRRGPAWLTPGWVRDVPEDVYYSADTVSTAGGQGVFAAPGATRGSVPMTRLIARRWRCGSAGARTVQARPRAAVSESKFDDVDPDGFYAPFIERMSSLVSPASGAGDGSGLAGPQCDSPQMAAFWSGRTPRRVGLWLPDVDRRRGWFATDVSRAELRRNPTDHCGDRHGICPPRHAPADTWGTFFWRGENPDQPFTKPDADIKRPSAGRVLSTTAQLGERTCDHHLLGPSNESRGHGRAVGELQRYARQASGVRVSLRLTRTIGPTRARSWNMGRWSTTPSWSFSAADRHAVLHSCAAEAYFTGRRPLTGGPAPL